jgi:hypothetical protein
MVLISLFRNTILRYTCDREKYVEKNLDQELVGKFTLSPNELT